MESLSGVYNIIKVESKDMSLKEYVSLIMFKEYVTISFMFLCYFVLKNMSLIPSKVIS